MLSDAAAAMAATAMPMAAIMPSDMRDSDAKAAAGVGATAGVAGVAGSTVVVVVVVVVAGTAGVADCARACADSMLRIAVTAINFFILNPLVRLHSHLT